MKNRETAEQRGVTVELVKYGTEKEIKLIAKILNRYVLNGDKFGERPK